MSDDECDILCNVAKQPGRKMMVSDLKTSGVNHRLLPALIRDKRLVYFEGGWVGLTDGGYDAMIRHCAANF